MSRLFFLIYGGISYLIFFVTFLYAIGFTTNLVVPKGIDGIPQVPLSTALTTNLILLAVFALQHSIMARRGFKRWWTKFIPEPIERSTFVLCASLALILLFWNWQPMGGVVWSVSSPLLSGALTAASLLGFSIVLVSTFIINHFDLFGLRQVWLHFRKKPYVHLKFSTRFLYNYVRHPLYLGFLIAFWATPTMTITHLLFAIMTTAYILVAIQLEERDLVSHLGNDYVLYRKRIPMLFPFLKSGKKRNEISISTPEEQMSERAA